MSDQSRNEQARHFYNAAGTISTDFSFMNYGFAPLSAELADSREPEKYCLQLYRRLIGDTSLGGRRVVEVSCGRGGGAAHVAASFKPASYLGIDISEQNLALATQRFAHVENLAFQQGNAEALPLADASVDVVLNVEASHLYDNPARFIAEVHRVLVPGGVFANFEHVASATHRLHLKFFAAIDEPLEHEDPSDRLLDVETQLGWLRGIGFDDVDCYWKWLEMALLVGVKPGASTGGR